MRFVTISLSSLGRNVVWPRRTLTSCRSQVNGKLVDAYPPQTSLAIVKRRLPTSNPVSSSHWLSQSTSRYASGWIYFGSHHSLNLIAVFFSLQPEEEELPLILSTSPAEVLASSVSDTLFGENGTLSAVVKWVQLALRRLRELFGISVRMMEIILRLSPCIALTPLCVVSDPIIQRCNIGSNVVADFTWWYIIHQVQLLGPAFVKLCQWIATRRDVFPPHICDRFSILHDRGIPHSWSYTEQMLRQSFGNNYQERGLRLDKDCPVLGCGSAAQVYSATLVQLKPTIFGDIETHTLPVAVKVLHPHFEQQINRDITLMSSTANLLHSLPSQTLRMLNLPRATENFATVLRLQADLRIEGENLTQFRKNFYGKERAQYEQHQTTIDRSSVLFPHPMLGWTTKHVLVEELVTDAIPIATYMGDNTDKGMIIRKRLAAPLLRAFLKMVFVDNCKLSS
jgi:hypothetical protein